MSHYTVPVTNYMSTPVYSVHPATLLPEVEHRLRNLRISSLPVLDEDARLLGVVSRTDLLRVGQVQPGARQGTQQLVLPSKRVSEVMSRDPVTVGSSDTMAHAARLMRKHHIHRVFVIDQERVTGVIATQDLMLAVRDARDTLPIGELMSTPLFTVRTSDPIGTATERLEKAHVTGLVVIENDWPVGIFTRLEALQGRDLPRNTAVDEVMDPTLVCLPLDTTLHRAAAQTAALGARRIIACRHHEAIGILTGLDFARAVSA